MTKLFKNEYNIIREAKGGHVPLCPPPRSAFAIRICADKHRHVNVHPPAKTTLVTFDPNIRVVGGGGVHTLFFSEF